MSDSSVGRIDLDLGLDYTQFNRELKNIASNAQSMINGTFRKFGVALATAFTIDKAIIRPVKAAMTVESSIGQISRTLKENATIFNDWVKTQAKGFGLARTEAFKYEDVYSNLISGFAKSTAETALYTQQLIQSSAVVASKTGRTMEDTMDRIRSGLLGNTEAIEDLGINVNIAMIESTNAFKKFANGKSWQQLNFQTQQQIRLTAILEQAHVKYGDTLADTTATKQMRFIATLKNIQLYLGQAFLPIYNVVLPALTSLASKLEAATARLAAFSQALFGKPILENTASLEGMSNALLDTGSALKKTGKAVKGTLGGFDQLNILTQSTSNAMEDIASGAVGVPGSTNLGGTVPSEIGIDENTLAPIRKFIDEVIQPLKNISLKPLSDSFTNLKNAIAPFTETLFAGLKWAYTNIFVPFSTWTIEKAFPAFLNSLVSAFNILKPILEAFKPLGGWLWESFLKPIAKWTGGVIISILEGLTDKLTKLGDWIGDHKVLVQDFAIVVGSFAAAWSLVNTVIGIWTGIGVIATGVTAGFGAAVAFLTSPITLVVLAIGAIIAVVVLLIKHWDDVKAAASKAWEGIKGIWNQVAIWFETTVVQPIKIYFGGLWTKVKELTSEAWSAAKSTWNSAAGWFDTTVIQPVKKYFTDLGTKIKDSATSALSGLKSTWSGISNWFNQNVIQPITNLFKNLISSATSWGKNLITNFTDGIKAMAGRVADAAKGIASKVSDFIGFHSPSEEGPGAEADKWMPNLMSMLAEGIRKNIPKIAEAANLTATSLQGNLLEQPTLAMIGENNKKEAVIPLEDSSFMQDFAQTIAQAVVAALASFNSGNNNNGDMPDTLILKIGETEFGRIVLKAIRAEYRRTGVAQIPV